MLLFYGTSCFTRNEEVPKYVPQVLSKYGKALWRNRRQLILSAPATVQPINQRIYNKNRFFNFLCCN